MTVNVNLLPDSYRQARRHDRWFQRGIVIWTALVVVELCLGLLLHVRAGEERELAAAIADARRAAAPLKQGLADSLHQVTLVERNIVLAKQLRAAHRWSQLLGALAQATPEDVMLSAVVTEPSRWSPAAQRLSSRTKTKHSPSSLQKEDEQPQQSSINGITIRGYATGHPSLSEFMTTLHASGVFATMDLQRMKTDQVDGREAISFELRGHW